MKILNRRSFIRNTIIAATGVSGIPLFTTCNTKPEEEGLPDFIPEGDHGFFEGVASFDPIQHEVILWTRYTPAQNENESPEIILDVATDENFNQVIASELVEIEVDKDRTVNVNVRNLISNTKYFYRFRNELTGIVSMIGETKTLPANREISEIKLAVVSCANYELGYFNAYEAIAKSDAEIIIHLGDYIYEGYRENHFSGRKHDPPHELISLDDYRTRYRQYRTDAQLLEAHRLKPFICIWDDHEFVNDANKDGSSGHQPDEGDYQTRLNAGIQAWHEYLPNRASDNKKIFRSFDIGGILNLMMLDTRIIGREKQLNYKDYLENNILDEQFYIDWKNPNRTLLGDEQKSWLIDKIQSNKSKWQVLGNQVLMGKHYLPEELIPIMRETQSDGTISSDKITEYYDLLLELLAIKDRLKNGDPSLTAAEKERVNNVVPYNLDSWDGYPAEREFILSATEGKKIISFAGASHNAWNNDLTQDNGKRTGTEFATTSITSSGLEGFFGDNPILASGLEQANVLLMDDVQYSEISKRGYILATFSQNEVKAEYLFVGTIHEKNDQIAVGNTVIET